MIKMNRNKEYRLKRKAQRKDYIIQDKNLKLKTMYYQNKIKKEKIEQLQQQNKLLKHRLKTANDFIEDRKENMIPEHYDDLKYIINECDLNSSW